MRFVVRVEQEATFEKEVIVEAVDGEDAEAIVLEQLEDIGLYVGKDAFDDVEAGDVSLLAEIYVDPDQTDLLGGDG